MEIFENIFMVRAFAAGILVAVCTPLIGTIVVTKRLSMIGEALSHTALAGVAAGLLLNINPVLGAVFVCIIAALCIDAVRKKLPAYSELSIAIIMSAGLGIAGLLSGYITTSANFNAFLFGSIISITREEIIITAAICIVTVACFIIFYRDLFYIVFDERAARLSGVKVKRINLLFMLLCAVTVSAAARIVGALLVSSLMVIPVACAMSLEKSFKKTIIFSVLFALAFTIFGITLSFYLPKLKTSSAIVLLGVVCFAAILTVKKLTLCKHVKYNVTDIL